MKLTKYAHACVALEKDGVTVVLDPGTLTPGAGEAVGAAAAVLVTHEHFDHFDADLLTAALADRPDLLVFGPAAVADRLGRHGGRVTAVAAGDTFTVGGLRVAVRGERHALIHPDIPCVDNVGYLVDDAVFHPGDAYFVPREPVETLLLPTSGPWTKLGEAADYVRAVRPSRLIQIHELMLSELGQRSTATLLGEDGLTGTPVTLLAAGESLTV
ncbi:MBL fold metallo-hydrolase [Streptantibioticus silvisoli]|uniref:MBL fold metallo-hydrolase n=1 Tax=Streptantibioticus silvisoli TaxID=2705255 RepID=A0ABT6VWQ4_9ACTN|nr:MBL fold metallo-hydrolase [Streptantibioticus silvisoli]MDI5961701.1 MBL fold metallo-hydrolase [Streptantibioticus silvisoli]